MLRFLCVRCWLMFCLQALLWWVLLNRYLVVTYMLSCVLLVLGGLGLLRILWDV